MIHRRPQTYDEERLLAALKEVVVQACQTDDGTLHSMALSAYAGAFELLAEYDQLEITGGSGRNLTARLREASDPPAARLVFVCPHCGAFAALNDSIEDGAVLTCNKCGGIAIVSLGPLGQTK